MSAFQPHSGGLAGRLARALPVHYGWVVVLSGLLTVFACLGIGRFALGMLLPSMGVSLELSYSQMGLISTANFVGYLLAVLGCGRLVHIYGARAVIGGALLTVGLSLLLVSRSDGFVGVLLIYTVTGAGSGAANVPIMGLVSHWFARRWRGRAAGFIVVGSCFAIMTSGVLIPAVNATWGLEGWRYGWMILGLVVVAIALFAGLLLRNDPRDLDLGVYGEQPAAGDGPSAPPVEPDAATRRSILARLGLIYFLFGFTYVIYVTFIVTTLVQERGFSEAVAGRFWFWVGFLSLFSGPMFGWLSDHAGRRTGIAAVFAMHAGAYLCAGLPLPAPFLYLSIALFGLAAWSIPGIMAAAVGDYMGPRHAVAGFGTITFIFGIGQIIGPALAGILAEAGGGFASSYLLAAALAGLALVLTLTSLPRVGEGG
jgi:MFS family permease